LRSASLTEERDLHPLRGKREPERLQELALRDRPDLECGTLVISDQAESSQVVGEAAEHVRDRTVVVHGCRAALERRPELPHGRVERVSGKQTVEHAALVKGELPCRVALAAVEDPAKARAKRTPEAGALGFRLRELVQEVELGRTARADANDGFDAVSFRLADQFVGLCSPPLEEAVGLGEHRLVERSYDSLDHEPFRRVASEVVNFGRCRARPADPVMEQEVERLEDGALPGVLRAEKDVANSGRQRQGFDCAEPLDRDLPKLHAPNLLAPPDWQKPAPPGDRGLAGSSACSG
jgi:hypothetical protein